MRLFNGEEVFLETDTQDASEAGQLLRYVYLPDETFVNQKLVKKGALLADTSPPNDTYVDWFIYYEQQAGSDYQTFMKINNREMTKE